MATRVLGVLAGGTQSYQSLESLASAADLVIAADGGQDVCLAGGVMPDVVVGDMDSLSAKLPGVDYRERPDQNFSDCDKLLAEVAEDGPVNLVIAGFEGDRFDHVLSNLSSFVRSHFSPRLLLNQGYGRIMRAGDTEVVVGAGSQFSVLGVSEAVVSIFGSEWDISGRTISFENGFSLSNRVAVAECRVTVLGGVALLVRTSCEVNW